MGTRGAVGFRLDGKDYVAYNHFDSYPEGLGVEVLRDIKELLKGTGLNSLPALVKRLKVFSENKKPTKKDIKALAKYTDLSVSNKSTSDWYCLTRNLQGNLRGYLEAGYMPDSREFLADSLFCEWAYIVNLDDNTLEVYKGFNSNPNGAGRFLFNNNVLNNFSCAVNCKRRAGEIIQSGEKDAEGQFQCSEPCADQG